VADRRLHVAVRQDGPIPLDVTLDCGPGDTLVIFGPSGSGKTTVLRAIAGLYAPAHAVVRAGGETWTDTSAGTFVPPHRRHVGFVFQDYALIPAEDHAPLRQRMALTARAGPVAARFYDYMQTPPARAILERYGFGLPR